MNRTIRIKIYEGNGSETVTLLDQVVGGISQPDKAIRAFLDECIRQQDEKIDSQHGEQR